MRELGESQHTAFKPENRLRASASCGSASTQQEVEIGRVGFVALKALDSLGDPLEFDDFRYAARRSGDEWTGRGVGEPECPLPSLIAGHLDELAVVQLRGERLQRRAGAPLFAPFLHSGVFENSAAPLIGPSIAQGPGEKSFGGEGLQASCEWQIWSERVPVRKPRGGVGELRRQELASRRGDEVH